MKCTLQPFLGLLICLCYSCQKPKETIMPSNNTEHLSLESAQNYVNDDVNELGIAASRSGKTNRALITYGDGIARRYQINAFLSGKKETAFAYAAGTLNIVKVTWIPYMKSIKFPNTAELSLSLGLTDKDVDRAFMLIPSRFWDDFSGSFNNRLHVVVNAAVRDGFHPVDAYNGFRLPPANVSPTLAYYHEWVRFQLDTYQSKFPNPSPEKANEWLQTKLIAALQSHMRILVSENRTIDTYFKTLPKAYVGN